MSGDMFYMNKLYIDTNGFYLNFFRNIGDLELHVIMHSKIEQNRNEWTLELQNRLSRELEWIS